MTTSEKNLLNAMKDFKDSYNALLLAVDSYEVNTKTTVNDLPGFVNNYPFAKSLDELNINQWVDSIIEGCRGTEFQVLNYNYLNTGGNTMVGIFEVWLPDEKRVVYALTNEEGCTLSVVDYVSNELEVHDYDELMIDSVDWGRTTGHEKYFELYRHCLNVYTKSDCKYFGYTRGLPYHLLSDELQSQITAEYRQWFEANEYDSFDTDGEKIIVHPDYEPITDEDKLLKAVKELKRWHDTIAGVEEYYNEKYKLEFAGHKIELPFMASSWTGVDDLLKYVIDQW